MNNFDLNQQLLNSEKIVWSGAPARGFLLTGTDTLLIPFSIVWCGFSIFWEASVLSQQQSPFFFKLFGIPFVLVGLYLVLGRFLVDAWIRKGIRYAVTNKRILISRPAPFAKLTALSLDTLLEASLSERANGRGTIRVGQPVRSNSFSSWTPSLDPTPQFLNIEEARNVFIQIQGQARSVTRSST